MLHPLYETECEHDHEPKNVGVCLETREYIETIFKLGTKKPKAILTHIEKLNRENLEKNVSIVPLVPFELLKQLEVPLLKDLRNYINNNLKKKICGKSTMHVGELADWCIKSSTMTADTEENQDKQFVVCFMVKIR